jgi:hypothetical protein
VRRAAWVLLVLGTCAIGQVDAAPSAGPALPRGVARRIERWQQAAGGPLQARYRVTRTSAMLDEPLVVEGALRFTPPDRLELRDDDPRGATTIAAGADLTISANDPALVTPAAVAVPPARAWLLARLCALLAARDPAALLAEARASVPRGPGQLLELSPPRSHPARRSVDRLRVRLDPHGGEVLGLELFETGGDRVVLELSEHRRGP